MKGLSTKTLRTFATYTALAIGVTVGGVVIGAMVVAPAVSRAKPLMRSIGGKPAANDNAGKIAETEAVVAVVTPFKPMVSALQAEAIADSAEKLVRHFAAQPTGVAAVKANATRLFQGTLVQVARVPKTAWLYVDAGAVLLLAGFVVWRRRSRLTPGKTPAPSVASTPSRSASGKGSRTPRAVVALAESGASAADIARRTRMPLDAVAMCLSMGSMGARQLQPPTA